MINSSESILKIAPALIKAKAEFVKAKTSKQNSHLGNKYATLADVLDAVEPALNANSVMVIQSMSPTSTETVLHMVTKLLHSSGEFMDFQLNIPVEKKTGQGYGSTISYARRYALAAALGISQTDDDAEIAKLTIGEVERNAKAITDLDGLRSLWQKAKSQLSAAEWKQVHPALTERMTELQAAANAELQAEAVAETSSEKPAGFNPARPAPAAKVDKTPSPEQNKPSTPIESFE